MTTTQSAIGIFLATTVFMVAGGCATAQSPDPQAISAAQACGPQWVQPEAPIGRDWPIYLGRELATYRICKTSGPRPMGKVIVDTNPNFYIFPQQAVCLDVQAVIIAVGPVSGTSEIPGFFYCRLQR